MIAIDTNVLLRYLLTDDKVQAARAAKLINGSKTVLVTDIALVETIWTLKGKKYGMSKAEIIQVILSLFVEPNIVFEDNQTVWQALYDYRQAKPVTVAGKRKEADFPDALLANKAKYGAATKGEVLEAVYSFDRAAGMLPGVMNP